MTSSSSTKTSNISGSSNGSMLRAAQQLQEDNDNFIDARRYLTDEANLDDFVPTQDGESTWLQCFRKECAMIQPLRNSVKLARLKHRCLGKTQLNIDHDTLLEFAVKYGETSGKWILRTTEEHVDGLWRLLARALLKGSLEKNVTSLKCSTRRGGTVYTLCIYIDNGCIERNEVMHVRETLHDLGADRLCIQPLYWKPELYTHLPFNGKTYLWIDGTDTAYWFEHWNNKALV